MSELTLDNIDTRLKVVEEKVNSLTPNVAPATPPVPQPTGGFFGGADDSFIANETTTKLYTGPVLGGKGKKTRRHKNKRHSYSRKSKKGLKNKLKRMFGFKGGEGEPTLSLQPQLPDSVGGTTNVKSPL